MDVVKSKLVEVLRLKAFMSVSGRVQAVPDWAEDDPTRNNLLAVFVPNMS